MEGYVDRSLEESLELTAPLVTLGFTAFNAAPLITRAIESGLVQTWPNSELLVVDDASTDATSDILTQLRDSHSRIRVFRNDHNMGIAASRNRLLSEAKGEFVAFFDDDDVSLSIRVEKQLERIVSYEKTFASGAMVICHTARLQQYGDGKSRIEPTMGTRANVRAPHGMAVAHRILVGKPIKDGYGACATCSQMARRSTYRYLNGFDVRFRRSSDTDFNIRLAKAGGHFVGIPDPLVTQTMTVAEKNIAEEFRNMRLLLEVHQDILGEPHHYAFCLRWLDAKRFWLQGDRRKTSAAIARLTYDYPVLTASRALLALRSLGSHRATRKLHSLSSTTSPFASRKA